MQWTLNMPPSEILLYIDYTASSKRDAETTFCKLTLQLKERLSPCVMIKKMGKPTIIRWHDKKNIYQVLYILYAEESFDQIRDKLSNQWDVRKKQEAVWRRKTKEEETSLQNPYIEAIFLGAIE